jgi:NAD(P)-dependent dehydrogenase (short-subunit alcohol dehydrogenase family)
MRLDEQVVIVTGSGRGTGRCIAETFAAKGARVVVATRSDSNGKETVEHIVNEGGKATFIQTNVAEVASIKKMIEETEQLYGRVDTLINNAGIYLNKPILEINEQEWYYYIDINLKGTFFCSQQVIPSMKRAKGGSIVNISSFHAGSTLKGAELYAAAKGGINAMTRAMSISAGADQIRVNSICPGFIETPTYERWLKTSEDPETLNRYMQSLHPMGRIVKMEEVASLSVYLASEESKAITGASLYIDCGLSAQLYNERDV